MTRMNYPYTYFKYFVLILPLFVLLSCTKNNNDLEPEPKPEETKTYTVTFDTDGGSDIMSQRVVEGGNAVKPTNDPTKDNLTFVGWSTTADGTGDAFDFDTTLTEDIILYAIWADWTKSYTITFNSNGGSDVESQTIAGVGKVVKPTDPTKDNLTFAGWSTISDGTGEVFDFDTAVTKDLTLYAIWRYEVSFDTNGGSTVDNQTIVEGGKIAKPTDPTKDNLTFVGWFATADGTGDAFDFDTTLSENIILYVIWVDTTETYIVTFETNGGDAVSEQKIEGGSKVAFVGANQVSKAFIWWYTSPTFEINTRYDFDKVVTGDITLYAKWEKASRYTISENKITYISGASGIVEIPYSVDGSPVIAVEGGQNKSIFVFTKYGNNYTVRQVILPNSIKNIGDYAFSACDELTSIIIPDGVKNIGAAAFSNCNALTSIIIPDSVTSIGQLAFFYCIDLTSVILSNNIAKISFGAFLDCSSLTSITIPDSVTSIGNLAFRSCRALMSITIPDSVTSIGNLAFNGCKFLKSITIPDSVTSIGRTAFSSCTSLASVRVEATTPPTLCNSDIFNNTPSSLSITVPAASLETYKTNTFWSPYADRITEY